MKNKIHIAIEIALVAIILILAILLCRSSNHAVFSLQDGAKIGVVFLSAKDSSSGQEQLAVFLNNLPVYTPIFSLNYAHGNFYYTEMENKDGWGIDAKYTKGGSGPFEVTRSAVTINGRQYLLHYNDQGEIDEKVDLKTQKLEVVSPPTNL